MDDLTGQEPAPRRPAGGRGRDEVRRRAILVAAGELMMEGGLAAATVEAIAARARVSKQTIYNWWPSRGAVALEGLTTVADPLGAVPEEADAADALAVLVAALARLFTETPGGPLMRGLVAEAQRQPDVAEALREQWLRPRRDAVVSILRAGVERGELRADLDLATAVDHAFGPVYYRLLMGHEPITPAFVEATVRQLLVGILAPRE